LEGTDFGVRGARAVVEKIDLRTGRSVDLHPHEELMTKTSAGVRISPAQMCALETAGVFAIDEADAKELHALRAAIRGNRLSASHEVARALHELANGADELGHEKGRANAAMYRADSRSLTALACKVSRSAAPTPVSSAREQQCLKQGAYEAMSDAPRHSKSAPELIVGSYYVCSTELYSDHCEGPYDSLDGACQHKTADHHVVYRWERNGFVAAGDVPRKGAFESDPEP
jgi:hypothetical protein